MVKRRSKKSSQKLSKIRENIESWFEYYGENISRHREDHDFVFRPDGQWTNAEINEANEMAKFGKTRLTFNMLAKVIYTLTGEYASNEPDLKVRCTDTSVITQQLTKKINVLAGLLRNISQQSRNDEVYKSAFKSALVGGFGAFRICVEDDSTNSFNQIIRYKAINDPTMCFWDPASVDTDKGDGSFAGICYVWKKTEFKSKYPGVKIPHSSECNTSFQSFDWISEKDIVIADYYEKEFFKKEVALLSDGRTLDLEDAEMEVSKSTVSLLNPQQIEIVDTKSVDDFRIHFYRMAGDTILEERIWDGKRLPIIFQAGIIEKYRGREYTYSVIRWMKSAQRSYNFARNEILWRLKLLRHEKWLVQDEHVEGHENEWKQAHLPSSALLYKKAKDGSQPIRIPPGEIPQSLNQEVQHSLMDLQQIIGRFEANQGQLGNEVSGLAILNRQKAGNLSVSPFFDAAESALQSGAAVVLDLIPRVYDNERNVQIMDENNKTQAVKINEEDEGINLTEGAFEVDVNIGPNFETQKAEAVRTLMEAYRSNPGYAQISSDILAKNLDIKDASLLADRARTYLQPQITMNEMQNMSQEQIIQQNMQQQAQGQQMQQQMLMHNMQLDQMIKQQKAQDDRIKAISSSVADLMNAQTNRQEAQSKGMIEANRANAEIQKANRELQIEEVKLAKEAIDARMITG